MATRKDEHVRLFLPGPVEVRPEVLDAQAGWMVGHRSAECLDLIGRLQPMLRKSFKTNNRVYALASTGSGFFEAAARNAIRDDGAILHFVNGAFSSRWADVSRANGKQVDVVEVEWGKAVTPDIVVAALSKRHYDAVALAYNETSTGVLSPLEDVAAVVHEAAEDTLMLADAVSAYMGAPIDVDGWGLDMCFASSQKALALPPGLAMAAVTDRVLARAEEIPHRGYYFDLLTLEKYLQKNQTPSTTPISLLYALERQLVDILDGEGLQARMTRHAELAAMTRDWFAERGFEMFAQEGYESPTVSAIKTRSGVDAEALNAHLRKYNMIISGGYGKIKSETFRVAHMGDTTRDDMQRLFDAIDDFLGAS